MTMPSEDGRGEHGFTLIELMVVILIIGILIAIALPSFLGARNRAFNLAAEAGDRNALVVARTCLTAAPVGDYSKCVSTNLTEPNLVFFASNKESTGPNEISVAATAATWYGAAHSLSGLCFFIKDDVTGGTSFAKSVGPCSGTNAAALDIGNNYSLDGWA